MSRAVAMKTFELTSTTWHNMVLVLRDERGHVTDALETDVSPEAERMVRVTVENLRHLGYAPRYSA